MFLQNPIYNFTLYNIKVGFITTHFTGYQAAELETSLNISRILKQRIHACMFERTKFDIDPYLKICCISNSQRSRILTSCNCTARDPPRCSRCGAWTHLLPQDRTEQDHGHLHHQHHHHHHHRHHHHITIHDIDLLQSPVPGWAGLQGLLASRTSCYKSSSQAGIQTIDKHFIVVILGSVKTARIR